MEFLYLFCNIIFMDQEIKIRFIEKEGSIIAEVVSDSIIIESVQEALDIMADCSYQGADKMIWYEENIIPDFFDLKTCLAGDILQKFSNYRMKLAIVGEFSKYTSKSLRDFIYESNKGGSTIFVKSLPEALEKL